MSVGFTEHHKALLTLLQANLYASDAVVADKLQWLVAASSRMQLHPADLGLQQQWAAHLEESAALHEQLAAKLEELSAKGEQLAAARNQQGS